MKDIPIVCITGCSSGFGLKIALECAKTCQVIATVRSEKGRQQLLDQMIKENVSIDIQLCDVTKSESIENLVRYITNEYTTLNVLINNAGIGLGGFFEDTAQEQIETVFQTNCFGLMSMTRACLPLLKKASPAKIINISSIAGLTGTPMISVYNSSKWAVEGLSEALLFELKPFGVDVIVIEPGQFKTKIFSDNLNLAHGVTNKESAYFGLSKKLLKQFESRQKKGVPDPKPVIRLCTRLVHKKRTRFRYLVGTDATLRFLVRRWLPFELYRIIVNKFVAKIMR